MQKSKNKYLQLLFSTLALLILFSCQETPEFLSNEELYAYVQDPENGLLQEKEVKDIKLQVFYKPTDFLVEQELGSDPQKDSALVSSLKKKYEGYAYFVLDLSTSEGNLLYKDMNLFGERLQTLAFRMDQYVYLTTSAKDTIPVADFNFPRLYTHSPSASVLFAFDREQIRETEWIDFHLLETGFAIGNQRMRFETNKINHIPKLRF